MIAMARGVQLVIILGVSLNLWSTFQSSFLDLLIGDCGLAVLYALGCAIVTAMMGRLPKQSHEGAQARSLPVQPTKSFKLVKEQAQAPNNAGGETTLEVESELPRREGWPG